MIYNILYIRDLIFDVSEGFDVHAPACVRARVCVCETDLQKRQKRLNSGQKGISGSDGVGFRDIGLIS